VKNQNPTVSDWILTVFIKWCGLILFRVSENI